MLCIQLKDRRTLLCCLVEVVELEIAGGAVAVERDALRGAPRRRKRSGVELQRLPVAAAPVELVRPLDRRRARHRPREESGGDSGPNGSEVCFWEGPEDSRAGIWGDNHEEMGGMRW